MLEKRPLLECEIEYLPSPHLMQLYAGFFELQRKGIIRLKVKAKTGRVNDPIITACINNKYKVVYDTLDGLSWIVGDRLANLEYFQNNFRADFYFKRSYHPLMQKYKPQGCAVLPLGLNYNIQPNTNLLPLIPSVKDKIKYLMKTHSLLKSFSNKRFYYARDFEDSPAKSTTNKILFITRLWDPNEAKSEASREHRKRINELRIECIETCRKEFGQQFTGGVSMDSFSATHYKEFTLPDALTNKGNYLQSVKEHSICIATTGLHDSIGWKLAEYVAASRAIVSEPLCYELPGDFQQEKNYLVFTTAEGLVHQIKHLLNDKAKLKEMMEANFNYYNTFVRPDNLVLNTLLQVIDQENEADSIVYSTATQHS